MKAETKCSCQHCSGHIAFERQRAGQTVACPHCGLDTTLRVRAEPAQQTGRLLRTRRGIALIVCVVVAVLALVAALLAGFAGRKPKEAEESAKVSAAQLAVTNAETAEDDLTLLLHQFPTTGDYLEGFAPPVFKKTVTDADGRFSITYPRGKAFTLFATAQRLVAETTEHYCWLVDAPTNFETDSFILSTGNLTLIDPDAYFEHKPQ